VQYHRNNIDSCGGETTESAEGLKGFWKAYDSALLEISFVFIQSFSNIVFNKNLKLKLDSATLSGDPRNLTYFVYFFRYPL
jgi:hypothetical protein